MKLIFDDSFNIELKKYLLTQEGIKEVAINEKNFISEITIKFNEKTNQIYKENNIDIIKITDLKF